MTSTFTLYPSARVVRRFRIAGLVPAVEDPTPRSGQWRVESFSLGRASYMLAVNVPTLLSGILNGPTVKTFETDVASKIRSILASAGLVTAPNPAQPFRYQKATDRSLIGSINDMIHLITVSRPVAGAEAQWLAQGEAFINRTPFRYLNQERPQDVFAQMLAGS